MSHSQPFWFRQAQALTDDKTTKPLTAHIHSDVCIVGGGYTGLWSAIKIKQQSPNTDVTLVEKGRCGEGASGRNGGCMLTFATKLNTLLRLFGVEEAIRLVQASEQAVFDIQRFCHRYNIDAEVRAEGALYTATNAAQAQSLSHPVSLLEQHGINRWQALAQADAIRLSGSTQTRAAIATDAAGSVHPGKLVLGLKKVAQSLGVKIYEQSPMTGLQGSTNPTVETRLGSVKAKKVVIAINGWMGQCFPRFNRHYVLVSSDMMITRPMGQALADIGLSHGKAVADSRIFVHYYRTSADGRLMLGKGGNLFAYGNKMLSAFDKPSGFEAMLKASFRHLFPALGGAFETSWTGASDRSATGLPFFGRLNGNPNVFYGLGYSGNGVVQSYLGGEILSSLVLGLDNAWARSGLAQGPLGTFPPEPIRYLGAQLVKQSVQRKERCEDAGHSPWWLDMQLSKLAAAAGKADK
ncbi:MULTISPECIES: FAD-dependent oxidoreductase [unclassified Pseudoalteromonas]|uniref:FAD-dependent oxidoreductase n=1 Tax=unclassified Pseudoalteromonas TaxID=194690 RepID=UPI0020981388|nr:FAD-dependent oxidoreductase [Pseudoalteromonas sp. XMcav2-N]MCO7188106.1 FAD-dependent oxidoreductase [Pseudoalteromonas sp. XMcav2-N]